ncbi:hypothetical protein HELRODRAFT_178857 [Helobdella robusta]|uniref:Uncharacterized protein n=1 Tax=Helobdella robusta TaxID=6412 RepID=T1FDT8_HELRO|nr:hypothetical protein HELRODRAFT_178857 [Helobdella robusta]ESN95939.1 hypothetical protein HELRODRAFT_178857 [Helobdella robusta]
MASPIFLSYDNFDQASEQNSFRGASATISRDCFAAKPSNVPSAYTSAMVQPGHQGPRMYVPSMTGNFNGGMHRFGGNLVSDGRVNGDLHSAVWSPPQSMNSASATASVRLSTLRHYPILHHHENNHHPIYLPPQIGQSGVESVRTERMEKLGSCQDVITKEKIRRRVYLALAAFCLNPLFGPVALLLAWTAQNRFDNSRYDEQNISKLLKASLGMSIAGFITTILTLFLTLLGFMISFGLNPTNFRFGSNT